MNFIYMQGNVKMVGNLTSLGGSVGYRVELMKLNELVCIEKR